MIYLYIKTHNVTGLKYFGKTSNKNPFTYKGSGTYWRRHIKLHGNDVKTEILGEFDDIVECRKVAIAFSLANDIVNSTTWANLKLETLEGGWDHVNSNPEILRRMAESRQGQGNSMYGKRHTLESRTKISKNKIGHKLGKQSTLHTERIRKQKCRKYEVISPDNNVYLVDDLPGFCKTMNLPYKTMSKIPNRGSPTRGPCLMWKVIKID